MIKKPAPPKKTEIKKKPIVPFSAEEKGQYLAEIALSKGAEEIVLLEVSELTAFSDYYLICSADSEPQIRAIVDAMEDALLKKKARPLSIEGMKSATWVLIDCNDVIVHIFKREARSFYNLERLWSDAKSIEIAEKVVVKKRG